MLERMSLFVLGGGGYLGIELAWRGSTHWTMFLAGGLCLCFLQALASRRMALPLAAVVGVLCRRLLHVAVWDYSAEWGNLAGLICPRYCFYWFLLCGWVVAVLRLASWTTNSPFYRTKRAAVKT